MSRESKADIVQEAKDRFKRCESWYSEANRRFLFDYKFANGDSYNWWQWHDAIRQGREQQKSPVLTINKTRQHNLQIINDAKQNKPGITFRPTGGGATYEAAQIYEGIARHIEYQSNAQAIYDLATSFQVQGGVGYWRVVTDYIDSQSFDQEIYLRAIPDPLSVFIDPDCKERDKSDATFGFIFEDVPKEKFDQEYPEYDDIGGASVLNNSSPDWMGKDHVRRCEYYRKVTKEDTLIASDMQLPDGSKKQTIILASELPANVRVELLADDTVNRRKTQLTTVEWYYIVGEKIIDKKVWLGETIPIVEVIGEETVIEGRYDRKGHTRALLDPQRIYNYWSSAAVEYGALQTKTPWIGALKSFEGLEDYWNNANRQNMAYLPYNNVDDDGHELTPPTRTEPPVALPVALQGLQTSANDMMMVSGQYEANVGAQGNERSAKAINERERQGETATYHYIDNLGLAIRRTGKIILDLIPKIYDTERTLMILAEDGMSLEVMIDPSAKQAFTIEQAENMDQAKRILNPNVGKYEVQADIGPAYGTKRQEAFNAFTTLLTQAPALTSVIGDILLKAGDFPGANEAAARLRRLVPPQALGVGPSQNEQQMTAQIEQMKGVMTEMLNENAKLQLQLKGKADDSETDKYNAETQRLKVVGDHNADLMKLNDMIAQGIIDITMPEKAKPADAVDSTPTVSDTPAALATRLGLKYPSIGGQ